MLGSASFTTHAVGLASTVYKKMKVMTSLLALLVLGILGTGYGEPAKKVYRIPPELAEKIVEGTLKCISKMGLDSSIVNKLKEGKYAEDDRLIEALLCVTTDLGIGFGNGKLNVDKLMNDMFPNKPEIRAILEACNKDYGKTPVENFKNLLVCFRDKAPIKVTL